MSRGKDQPQVTDIGCLEAIEGLYAWLDEELEDAESIEKIEDHISHCHSCYSRAEMERTLTRHIRISAQIADSGQVPQSLQDKLNTLLKKL